MSTPSVPLIAHLVHQFDTGGLENGMVNLLNRIPPERYRHAVVCLTGFGDYRLRITNPAVSFHALNKRPGKDPGCYLRLARLFKQLAPDLVHTRNLSALEGQFVAAACGVRARIHGEHGRDVFDLEGKSRKYNLLRRLARPLVTRYIAVSQDLARWLVHTVGVAPTRVTQIYNGVDGERFHPRVGPRPAIGPAGFVEAASVVIGSVGRMAAVKDFPTLMQAFVRVASLRPQARLVIIGEGVSRGHCQAMAEAAGIVDRVWLPGERTDIPTLMRAMDVFVLPSLGEGISNTILEAMASGLPVVATHVGGNPELVEEGVTGRLVPPGRPDELARALLEYVDDAAKRARAGDAARARVDARFSLDAMVRGYLGVYDEVLARCPARATGRG
ncbi:TIGR03088 family PEP-CTERM/XrtA system glycosyltransferase [Thiobacter aerophilum]|uniref:TIGR03088 family PEP-CTERM/XrtA system glycosyltransferase n=1 Tax=Thiobacter aerophilum TaxID=3121275 RepID=A0ABV0EDG8_9BURK